MLQIWRSQGNLQHLTKTCAVFAATQQIPTRGSRFFRITKKPVKLQRLISDFAKVRVQGQNVQRSGAKQIPPIGSIYSMLLNQYNRELNLVQHINTVLLASGQAETKVCFQLSIMHVSLTSPRGL